VVADSNLAAGIQAGSALTLVSGGTVLNTGNLYGSDVALSGTTLVNGITDSNQPTAATTVAPQAVQIGVSGTAVDTQGTPSTAAPVYALSANGSDLLSSFGPSLLVANLPAALQPDTNLFYYDASTEDSLIRQAAIKATGSGTFINGVAWSATDNLSVDDQQKAILYNNTIDFATANNVQLGTALTAQQIASLDKPMLWYTEQAVPDPSCSFTSTTCGTINALVPQVYLPANYAANTAGGVISGSDVTLNFSDSITNTGIIQATNLAVQTNTLTNAQRSVDIGTSAYKVQGGWIEYTGTQLQPGGFMSAVNMDVQAQRITAVNDAFQILNADGTVDAAGTTALLTSLRQKLGSDFTETTASDNIKTNFIKDTSGPGAFGQVLIIVAAIALAVVTAGAAAAALASIQEATAMAIMDAAAAGTGLAEAGGIMVSSTFAIDGMATMAIAGAAGAMATSTFVQLAMTGSVSLGGVLQSGLVGAIGGGIASYYGQTYDVSRLAVSTAGGCVTGSIDGSGCKSGATAAFVTASIAWAADAMRQNQIKSSTKFVGVRETNTGILINNNTGSSEGVSRDGYKLAGTRNSWDKLSEYGDLVVDPYINPDDQTWAFTRNVNAANGVNPDTGNVWTLTESIAKDGGLTGGAQGLSGTVAGIAYSPGSFIDKVLEAYAGPHDFLGSAFYDDLGNLKTGLSTFQKNWFEIQTVIDLGIATPFALTALLNQYGLSTDLIDSEVDAAKEKK